VVLNIDVCLLSVNKTALWPTLFHVLEVAISIEFSTETHIFVMSKGAFTLGVKSQKTPKSTSQNAIS
jgi:hypothetical protein